MLRTKDQATLALEKAIRDALDTGLTPDDIAQMVTTAQTSKTETPVEQTYTEDKVYGRDDLPDDLIDSHTLIVDHGANGSTLHTWIRAGKLRRCGRLKAPASGGGYTLVSREEVFRLMDSPINKGGRPPKQETT